MTSVTLAGFQSTTCAPNAKPAAGTVGVYHVFCSVTGKCYIGSTVCLRARFACHRSSLRTGRHYSPDMQRDFDAYGEDAFFFVVLSIHKDRESALRKEARLLRKLFKTGKLYNRIVDIDVDAMKARRRLRMREGRRLRAELQRAWANRHQLKDKNTHVERAAA